MILVLLLSSLYVVQPNEYGVVRQFGAVVDVKSEPGLYFKIPFVQEMSTLPNTVLLYDLPVSDMISADKTTLIADCFAIWRIEDPRLFIETLSGSVSNAEGRINANVYNALKTVLSRLWRRETRVVFTSHLTVRQSFLWRAVNRRITPHDAACIAVCTQGANLLRENGVKEEKIRVIFNGVAPKPLPPRRNVIRTEFSLPEGCFVFLTMARYAPEKGLFFLLDALAQLKERTDAPFACLIAGDGELFDAVGEGIRERGLDENVIRAGYRTDAEALMCSSDVYVSSALYNEAMSFAALEAMKCGLPLVMTDVGAGADLADGCGECVPPGDASALCDALHRLMTDGMYRRACGENARRRAVTEFDLTRQTEELLALYQKG